VKGLKIRKWSLRLRPKECPSCPKPPLPGFKLKYRRIAEIPLEKPPLEVIGDPDVERQSIVKTSVHPPLDFSVKRREK